MLGQHFREQGQGSIWCNVQDLIHYTKNLFVAHIFHFLCKPTNCNKKKLLSQ